MALRATKELFDRRYTADEFEQMPQFDDHYELIDGELVEKPMPGDEHGDIVSNIVTATVLHDPQKSLGKWWVSTSFYLDRWWQPIPDYAFVVKDKVTPRSKKSVRAIPDLVVEVHSPSDLTTEKKRDRAATKIAKYQAKGVRIIWAINPATQTVEVYHPEQALPVQILGVGETLDGEDVIPGFRLSVGDVFK